MVVSKMELYELLRKAEGADVDFLREGVRTLAQALMELEVSAQIGAEHGQRSPERVTHRNGYRPRDWDTRVGTVELQIPKLRQGSYFPSLLEPRRRAERALAAVVMQCYVEGVSTRRVDDVARAMGLEGISKSQVSRICAELDELVAAWRNRPLDAGPYPFLWIDALSMKVREGGRVCNTAVLVATACNADGHRELLGLELGSAEDGASWTGFLRGLVARGLSGVRLVTSDAHEGLKGAIAAVLDGASWQRCRTLSCATCWPPSPATLSRWSPRWSARSSPRNAPRTPGRSSDGWLTSFSRAGSPMLRPCWAMPRPTSWPTPPSPRTPGRRPGATTPGAAQPGNPPPHRRGRDLPRPRRGHPPGRCGPGRTARRVGRRSPLSRPGRHPRQPHHPRRQHTKEEPKQLLSASA